MSRQEATSTLCLRIPARAEYLVFGRLVLTGLSRTVGLDPEVLSDLKLAVTEACSNSVRHAYDDDVDGHVEIRYELSPSSLSVEVLDEGRGLSPEEPVQYEARGHGMGFGIIQAVVDDLELSRGPDGAGARVKFTKYLR